MTSSSSANSCPQCGSPVPPDAPRGLCPMCVLAGVITPTEPSQPADHPEVPSLHDVQAAFPQLEVLELIGQGGMGFVYKARQLNLDRLVALKILLPRLNADLAFAERFSREARVLARLNHPNIVAVYDFGQTPGFFYLLMEFVDGVNLRQAMRSGKFSPAEALALVPRICDALQYAHDEGILHRDIKPENILLDTKGRVKIADFGIAKLVGDARENLTLTATGAAVGTPHYMAPEQLEHPQDVDRRADIYSLGVVFYEMLTGELPIGRFAPPSEKARVDRRVDAVVLRALEREREKRYGTAGEIKTDVELVAGGAAPLAQAQPRFAGSSLHLLLCVLLSILTLWFLLEFGPPALGMLQGPDLPLLSLGRQWHLGNTVWSIFSKIVALVLMLALTTFFAWRSYRRVKATGGSRITAGSIATPRHSPSSAKAAPAHQVAAPPITPDWQSVWLGLSPRTRLSAKAAIVALGVFFLWAFAFYRIDYVREGYALVRTGNVGWGEPWLSFWRSPSHHMVLDYGLDFFTFSFAAGLAALLLIILLARIRRVERLAAGSSFAVRANESVPPGRVNTDSRPREAPLSQISAAATGLLIVGLLNCLPIVLLTVAYFIALAVNPPGSVVQLRRPAAALLVPFICGLVSGIVIMVASRMLKRLASRQFAIVACILATIPPISPAFLIGIPISIWCLRLLQRPEVKAAFVQGPPEPRDDFSPVTPGPDQPTTPGTPPLIAPHGTLVIDGNAPRSNQENVQGGS